MAELRLNGVEKIYPNGFHAIHGIDLDVSVGEFIVLVGPSGCGKSTLLRMVAGLETISSGEVEIAGRTVNELEPADRDIAMVFQNYALYPHMTVQGNMAYGLKNRGMARDEIDRRVREAAEILELSALLDRRPNQLSGGQRQRVAMGRAIVREPSVFLFDEPLSNLDAKLRVQMRVEIKRLQRRLGITSLYVTHDQVEAMTMADRLVVMNGGRAEQIGTPIELYERPATTFVATFIGSPSMNQFEATVSEDGSAVVLASGAAVALPETRADLAGRRVILGIRPEDLSPTGGSVGLSLEIDLVEHLGADTLIHGHLEGEAGHLVTVRVGGQFEAGAERINLAANSAIHLFDPESTARL
ncbi:sn-glycerol-3-phosphate import ATP-binding protein UgpC [Nisaea sp.]|uniref:sn-glycerol-3-phosphate import ATP-binding protein UgpC n=1 Tax=Nisaea sp. TaxID=2024842 RepID=UPI003B521D77